MKRFISVLAPTLVAAAFLVPAFASAATINVPADQATIQAAVNAASAGDTIVVAAGTYAEHVTVNKSVTLTGANAGIAGNGVRVGESVITGDASGALQLTADNITVDGFKIMGGANALGSGIHMAAANLGYLIKNNLITGNQIGIYANSAGSSTIESNLFDSNNEAGSSGGSGIYSEFTDHMTIDSNEFKNQTTNNPIIFGATAAGVHKNLVVSNNNIHNNFSGIYILAVNVGAFTGNTISAPAATALSFSGDNTTVSVTKNTITNGERGIRIEDAGYGLGANSNIIVNRNAITGNTEYGLGNITSDTPSVDATCNWWGSASGPGFVGPGTGDRINATSTVTFGAWLTTSDLTGACNGPLPLQGHIIVDKVTSPSGDPQSFAFTTTGTGYNPFSLTDAATPNDQTLDAGTYTIAETPVSGWTLNGGHPSCIYENQAEGTGVTNGEQINLAAGDTVTCTFTNTKNAENLLKVHILKYLDGVKATAITASNYQFPMTATWQTANLNGGVSTTGTYVLGNNHGGAPDLYGADTAPMQAPADYTTSEITDASSQVVASAALCAPGKYLLNGYRMSTVDFATAATQPLTALPPVFTGLTNDRYVIVDNSTCQAPPQCTVNATQTIVSDTATQVDSHNAVAVTPHPAWTTLAGATWVYSQALDANGSSPTGTKVFTRAFTIAGTPADSSLVIAADNTYTVSVNGHAINTGTSGTDLDNFTATDTWVIPAADLLSGSNTITFTVTNTLLNPATGQPFGDPNPGGLLYKLTINNCVTTPPGTGSISGIKFEDWDADKSPYESKWEIKLSGWTIYLDTNNNGALDSGEPSTVTDSHGAYSFTGLAAGTYHVREVQQAGWVGITPTSGKYDVTITVGKKVKDKNFGNFKLGIISGLKFEDKNGNHKKDAGEAGLPGWTINLTGPHGFTATTVTDANGNYSFTGLMQGTYHLSEVMKTGWKQTVHPGNVKINSGTYAIHKNFGNKVKVTGDKNKDKDDGRDLEDDN